MNTVPYKFVYVYKSMNDAGCAIFNILALGWKKTGFKTQFHKEEWDGAPWDVHVHV